MSDSVQLLGTMSTESGICTYSSIVMQAEKSGVTLTKLTEIFGQVQVSLLDTLNFESFACLVSSAHRCG